MAPQPSAGVEVWPAASTHSHAASALSTGKAWGAQAKSRKGRAANAPSGPAVTGQIQQLKEMGFSEKQARDALAECVWDVNKALDLLFTRGAVMGGGDDAEENPSSTSSAEASVGKGDSDVRAEARSPVASGKVRTGAASSGNSPAGADSAEQSTAASTASTPRSSGEADKSSGNSAGASAPLSPESIAENASGASTGAAAEQESAAEVASAEATREKDTEAAEEKPIENEAVSEEVSHAEESPEGTVQPPKQLARVSRAWDGEDAQLKVQEGEFVSVWPSTVTEHGWIYAEDVLDSEKAGWLPGCVLEELPSTQRWLRATQSLEAAHDSQLSIQEGSTYKVSLDTRTKEGWIYAEFSGVTSEDAAGLQAGWAPVFCFKGADAELQA